MTPKKSEKNVLITNKKLSEDKFSEINSEEKCKDVNYRNNNVTMEVIKEQKFDDYELNNLEYDLAIKLDK